MRRARVLGALALLALYPQAWRERYRDEVAALIEDDPPRLSGLAGLVFGGVEAHLRPRAPWRTALPRARRARLSITGLFSCWLLVSIAGAGFQKETEAGPFRASERHHLLLAVARDLVIAGAVAGSLAIAYGGLPLLARAVRQAARTRDAVLAALLLSPLAALGIFAAVAAIGLAAAPADAAGASLGVRLALYTSITAAALGVALTAAIASRAVLARVEPSTAALRRALAAGGVLTAAMALVTAGLLVYAAGLSRLDAPLSAQSGGPVWPTTSLALATCGTLAAVALGLAVLARGRAEGALR